MRFATDMTGGSYVPESQQLVKLKNVLTFLGTSASGKTRAIFDAARQRYTIYVVCLQPFGFGSGIRKQLEELLTPEKLFPTMSDEIAHRCQTIKRAEVAREEGYRLITADICLRVVFLNWFLDTFKGRKNICTPEQFLLLQLHGGQECMLQLFERLLDEPLRVIEEIVSFTEWRLRKVHDVQPLYAIDEAQLAADSCKHAEAPCQFVDAKHAGTSRSLLYAYCRTVNGLLHPPMVIAGTDLMPALGADTAHQQPSDLGKATIKLEPLPVLSLEDVKRRLSNVLNLTPKDLADTGNLYQLVGRPRWCARVVTQLAAVEYNGESKSDFLNSCIEEVVNEVVKNLADKLLVNIKGSHYENLMPLLKKIFIINELFKNPTQGVRTLLTPEDAEQMLKFGLGQVITIPEYTEPDEPSVPVALSDYVTRAAVAKVAAKKGWNLAQLLTDHFMKYQSDDARSAGLQFEIVVAGAIASHGGTVADFVRQAATLSGQESLPKLPAWASGATFGGVGYSDYSRERALIRTRVMDLLKSGGVELMRGPDTMRLDLLGISQANVGQFVVSASTKLHAARLAGMNIVDDMTSTMPSEAYKNKPSERSPGKLLNVSSSNQLWTNHTWPKLQKATQGRILRIQVVLRKGYNNPNNSTIAALKAFSEIGKSGCLEAVHVKGNEIRVIIDQSNYAALFTDPKAQKAIANIINQKSKTTKSRSKKPEESDSVEISLPRFNFFAEIAKRYHDVKSIRQPNLRLARKSAVIGEMSQAAARSSGAARQLLRDAVHDLCCSEDEDIRVESAREIAVAYSTESPDAWSELWTRLFHTFQRTLALYSYSYPKGDAAEVLIEVDDDKQTPSVRATAHIQCFLGCCELALQLLRAGCSAGPVVSPAAQLLAIISDTCALRVHAQVQANPDNVAFTVGARDGELPKLSLARIEPLIQDGAVQMLIQLLDIQDLCLGHAQQISRLLNLTSAFINKADQPSESTTQLAATTLELFGSVAAAFPHIFTEGTVSAAVDALMARLLEVAEHCCAKPVSIVAETQTGKPAIAVRWCVDVLGTVRRVLLYCSPILSDKHRQTIEGAICMMLGEMLHGIVQPLLKHKSLKREPKSLVRSDTHVQLAILELAQVEAQTLHNSGGIGANIALLRPCASLFVRATSAPLRDAAAMCLLVSDTLLRPIAAPLDLQPAVRRMEDHLASKSNDDHSAQAFASLPQSMPPQSESGAPADKKRRTTAEHASAAQKKRFNLAEHLTANAKPEKEISSADTKKPFALPSFGVPSSKSQSQQPAKPAADNDDDDLPDLVLDDPDQL